MDKKWTIASIAVAILVAVKWLPFEELACVQYALGFFDGKIGKFIASDRT